MTINRRIVTSVLSIGTAGALLVGATFAFFSDTATSNNNQFTSGVSTKTILDVYPGKPKTKTISTTLDFLTIGPTVLGPISLKAKYTFDSPSVSPTFSSS